MGQRDPYEYDQERVVSRVHNDDVGVGVDEVVVNERVTPRRVERRTVEPATAADPDAPTAAYDAVVVERPYQTEREVAAYDATPAYVADDVREDVTIDRVVARRAALDRVSSMIWFFTGLLEVLLALRIAFGLLEANRGASFVDFVYGFTEPFVRPFQGMFNDPAANGAVLDSSAVMAMIIYALAAWAVVRLIWLAFDRAETGRARSVSRVHSNHL